MESKRLQILKAFAAALDGPGKPPGLHVHRHPERPLHLDQLPAIVVYDAPVQGGVADRAEIVRIGGPRAQRHTLNIVAELRVALDGETPPDDLLDPLYVWAVQAMVGAELLDGLLAQSAVETTSTGLQLLDGGGEVTYAGVGINFEVVYERERGDPTQ